MPDININIAPGTPAPKINMPEKKIADDSPDGFSPDYDFINKEDSKDNQQPDLNFEDPNLPQQPPMPVVEEALNPEKEMFKNFLVSLRDGMKDVLDAENSYKKLNLHSIFPEGEIGTGVYMLNVAEVRDRLQKTTASLSDIFNAFSSISTGGETPQSSGFFTDQGYTASIQDDIIDQDDIHAAIDF